MNLKKTGAFIAQCRREAGLTQKELAERLHISDRAVSKWERGLNLPGADLFEPLCQILNITVRELLRGERCEDDVILPEEIAQAMYRLEAMEREEKQRRRGNRVVGIALLLAAILTAAIVGGRYWYQSWQAQQRADLDSSRPTIVCRYSSRLGYVEMRPYPGGMYGPFNSDESLFEVGPEIQREPEYTDRFLYHVEEFIRENVHVYVFGAKSEMTIQVLRWPLALQGTEADFSDGETVEFYQSYQTDDRGADLRLDVPVEQGYLYSVVFGWGEGYYVEYPFLVPLEEPEG